MLVANWKFSTNGGTSGYLGYPYQNYSLYVDNPTKHFQETPIPFAERWHYVWGTGPAANPVPAEVTHPGTGIRGQNTSNPYSLFRRHGIVRLDGKYYDPSYGGEPFTDLKAWENGLISGYGIFDDKHGSPRFVFRSNPGSLDIVISESKEHQEDR
jgi:hypothetical protein